MSSPVSCVSDLDDAPTRPSDSGDHTSMGILVDPKRSRCLDSLDVPQQRAPLCFLFLDYLLYSEGATLCRDGGNAPCPVRTTGQTENDKRHAQTLRPQRSYRIPLWCHPSGSSSNSRKCAYWRRCPAHPITPLPLVTPSTPIGCVTLMIPCTVVVTGKKNETRPLSS